MQVTSLFRQFDRLHAKHGSPGLKPIYGAGEVDNPKVCLVFMNPTGRNVSADPAWEGIRAPWIGTKNVWMLLHKLGLFRDKGLVEETQRMKPGEWTPEFAAALYTEIANESLYITNIAKCTQVDARHLPNSVYKDFLPSMYEELMLVRPEVTFAFGNQVSSVLLQRGVSVSDYLGEEYEVLNLDGCSGDGVDVGESLKVYPTYYPVGQGTGNMPKAVKRIGRVLGV